MRIKLFRIGIGKGITPSKRNRSPPLPSFFRVKNHPRQRKIHPNVSSPQNILLPLYTNKQTELWNKHFSVSY